ncbi:MAG: hypothetical protein ACLQNE_30165 [Thermoguttaceae bacterium]
MFSIVMCPKCGQQVSIPDGLDPALNVLCPLCQGEFTIGQVLAPAPVVPPAVIPVAHVPEPPSAPTLALPPTPAGESAGGEPVAAATQSSPAPVQSPAAPVAAPHVEEELGFADESPPSSAAGTETVAQAPAATAEQAAATEQAAAVSPSPEEIEEDDGGVYRLAGEKPESAQSAAAEALGDDEHFRPMENPFVDIFNDSTRAAAPSATADDPEAAHEDHAAMLGTLGFGSHAADGSAAAPAPARGWQPRSKKTNPIRFTIGLIFFGLMGLLVPYLLSLVFTAACSSKRPPRPASGAAVSKDPKSPIIPDENDRKKWHGLVPK